MYTHLDVPALMRIAAGRGDRSCYAIAKRTGVSQPTVLRLVNGHTAPTMYTLSRIAWAYGVAVSALLTTDDAPKSEAA